MEDASRSLAVKRGKGRMILENNFARDVVSHVAEIMLLSPSHISLNLVLGPTSSAFITIHKFVGDDMKVDIDATQIKFYEKLLKREGIDVETWFLNPFP